MNFNTLTLLCEDVDNTDGEIKYMHSIYDHGDEGTSECWYTEDNNGVTKFHRIEGPAKIEKHADGSISRLEWHVNGRRHRNRDKPAKLIYHDNGVLSREIYYKNGVLHRENGPAVIARDKDNKKIFEKWYYNNELHRIDGPAIIAYSKGEISEVFYYINGENLSDKDKRMNSIKNKETVTDLGGDFEL